MDFATFLILALATFRVARLIIEDAIFEPVREKIWDSFPPSHGLGYILTCYWCSSIYIATAFTIGYILIPSVVFFIALALALSATTGIISKYLDRD